MSRPHPIAVPLVLSVALLAACQRAGEPAAAVAERVENGALGIAIADLPDAFAVRQNDDGGLVLAPADGQLAGRLEVRLDPPGRTLNLVRAVEEHKVDVEARPDGDYKGGRELVSQLGAAYYSRGRFTADDGTPTEESIIVAIHPDGDRILRLIYRYPAGDDSKERLESMFELLGEIEGLVAAGGEGEAGDVGGV